jgi:hypothetical protein
MADPRKGSLFLESNHVISPRDSRKANHDIAHTDEEATTIKVASGKKQQRDGVIKLKKPAPKHSKPGNWKDGSIIDGESPRNRWLHPRHIQI